MDDVPIDPEVLWLPLKYQRLLPKLYLAAEAALEQPRCVEVKKGTVDLRQSTPEVSLFRILCREPSGLTYTEMVSSDGYRALTPKKNALLACSELLETHTQLMQSLTWVPSKALEEYASKSAAERAGAKGTSHVEEDAEGNRKELYHWDFDAKAINGDPLHFRADCTALNGENASIQIKAR